MDVAITCHSGLREPVHRQQPRTCRTLGACSKFVIVLRPTENWNCCEFPDEPQSRRRLMRSLCPRCSLIRSERPTRRTWFPSDAFEYSLTKTAAPMHLLRPMNRAHRRTRTCGSRDHGYIPSNAMISEYGCSRPESSKIWKRELTIGRRGSCEVFWTISHTWSRNLSVEDSIEACWCQ